MHQTHSKRISQGCCFLMFMIDDPGREYDGDPLLLVPISPVVKARLNAIIAQTALELV